VRWQATMVNRTQTVIGISAGAIGPVNAVITVAPIMMRK
jgi:hypothetical protein